VKKMYPCPAKLKNSPSEVAVNAVPEIKGNVSGSTFVGVR
jgi:hypothetical protein